MLSEQTQQFTGEGSEFRDLFLRYYQPTLRFFQGRGFSEADAADLVQETFFQIYRSWQNFRGESTVATWIFAVARHVAWDELRNRSALKRDAPEVSLDGGDTPAIRGDTTPENWGGDPLEEVLLQERISVLREAMNALPPQMRRCVRLRLDRELKYREIAEVMGISIDTVNPPVA